MINVRRHCAICSLAFALVLLSCRDGGKGDLSDKELHELARTLPLPERYDLYYEVYTSHIPTNSVLAEDIRALGKPAWLYTVERARSGDISEFGAAMAVLSGFEQKCSSREENDLKDAAMKLASDADLREALFQRIMVACQKLPPQVDD